MEHTNQPITSGDENDLNPQPQPQPNHPLNQSLPDDVTFSFNHLHINNNNNPSNPHHLLPEPSQTDNNNEEEENEEEDEDDEEEEEEDDDEDFTFMCVNNNNNNNDLDLTTEPFQGQIRNVFPLFDQSLLSSTDYDDAKRLRLPINVADKVFIESSHRSPLSNGEDDGTVRRLPINVPVDKVFIESPSNNGETDGTVRSLQTESDKNMKSNSTGFSKLWRFKNNEMSRSNSEGRDAFVFLEASDGATTSDGKVNGKGVKKGKKLTASAHEVYLKKKKKEGQTEDERRRSYLPYRPGLMGFFTNVNGGLSKNVHPF